MYDKVEGIVLRAVDYGESSKILTIFTREKGKIGGMAQGAKKPRNRMAAVAQPFMYAYFVVNPSTGMHTIRHGEVIQSFRDLREDLFKAAYGSYMLELTDKALEEKRPHPFLFELLFQTLHYLEEDYDYEIMTMMYELKILPMFGIKPIVDECACCSSTENICAFSVREGGFVCQRCVSNDPHAYRLTSAQVRLIRTLYHVDVSRLGSVSVKKETKQLLRKIIDDFYHQYCGIYIKSKRFLNQLDLFQSN